VAFVREWIDTLNRSTASGRVDALRSTSVACDACSAMSDYIEAVYDSGGEIWGRGWRASSVAVTRRGPGGVVVDAVVDVAPQTVTATGHATARGYPGGVRHKVFVLQPAGRSWTVVALDQSR
jgi:hypothetical protein